MDRETLQIVVNCLHSQANETFDPGISIAFDELANRLNDVLEEDALSERRRQEALGKTDAM